MSALQFTVDSEGEEALAAATAETIVQVVAPANHRLKVLAWGVSFDGVSPTAEPVQVDLLRQTTAGTAAAATPKKIDPSLSETIQSTAQKDFSAEPTPGDVLRPVEVHPQGGYEEVFPFGQEMIVGGGGRIGIRCTAPATVNVKAWIRCEE